MEMVNDVAVGGRRPWSVLGRVDALNLCIAGEKYLVCQSGG
jgi:hypothetical protein